MGVRVAPKSEFVRRCVARHDGAYMVVTTKGNAGVSTQEIPEGARVLVRDGQAVRLSDD